MILVIKLLILVVHLVHFLIDVIASAGVLGVELELDVVEGYTAVFLEHAL